MCAISLEYRQEDQWIIEGQASHIESLQSSFPCFNCNPFFSHFVNPLKILTQKFARQNLNASELYASGFFQEVQILRIVMKEK